MHTYLHAFSLPSQRREYDYILRYLHSETRHYPFNTFAHKYSDYDTPLVFEFEPITCLYGGNGSGKTTLLNIIAEKLALGRKTAFNRSPYFEHYLKLCLTDTSRIPDDSQIITSDDVFDYILDVRHVNQGIDSHRENLIQQYNQYQNLKIRTLDDFDALDLDKYKKNQKSQKPVCLSAPTQDQSHQRTIKWRECVLLFYPAYQRKRLVFIR